MVKALRRAIFTANLQCSIRILYDNCLNKITLFALSDAGGRFWFPSDLCEILGFREERSIAASEGYDNESVPDIQWMMTSIYVHSDVVDSRFAGN